MASFKEELKQAKEDILFLHSLSPMRSLMMEGLREEFRAKANKPGTSGLKKFGYKAAIVASYALG